MVHKRPRYPWDRGSVKAEGKKGAMQAARRTMSLAGHVARDLAPHRLLPRCERPSGLRARPGVPGNDAGFWHLFAPLQTPRSILQRLRAALTVATREEVARTRLLRLGMVPILDTPQEFARIVSDPQERLLRCPTTSI